MLRLLFLGNGWADFVEMWYALGNPLVTAYAVVTDGVSLHVRTCRPRFCISGTAWPIEFNFGVWVSSPYLSAFHKSWVGYLCTCARELGAYHKSWVGYLCTCARAHRASVSQKRLDPLCSNLVCGLGVTKHVLSTSQGWSGASLHVRTCTPISVSQDPSGQLC